MMLFHTASLCLVLCVTATEPAIPKPEETTVRIECRGKLRHGLVAIGGESTGTSITFDGTTWELKLPNEDSRSLADKLNKKTATVVGTLRHVRGVEVASRWIVDVDKLSAGEAEVKGVPKNEWATISVTGPLKRTGDQTDSTTGSSVAAGGIVWRLDFSEHRELDEKSKLFDGQAVTVRGRFVRTVAPQSSAIPTPASLQLKVSLIEVASQR